MKRVVCANWGPPEQLTVEDCELPPPAAGEVKIRVRAAALNFPDVLIVQKKYQLQPALPFTPGSEVAGQVIAVGEGVTGLREGDDVVAFTRLGAFAEEVIAPHAAVQSMPQGMDYQQAAAYCMAYGTAWHALRDRAELQPGETVLVLGAAGGVGLAAVQIAKAMDARVIAAASSAEKLALCRAHGADETVDYADGDFRAKLKALAPGGMDVVVDPVGAPFTEAAVRSLAWKGRLLVIGFAGGDIAAPPANLLLLKGASMMGVFWGEHSRREAQAYRASSQEMVQWIRSGRLKPHVSRTFALGEVPQAMRLMAERKTTGKVLIVP